jgi:hypothetical protein
MQWSVARKIDDHQMAEALNGLPKSSSSGSCDGKSAQNLQVGSSWQAYGSAVPAS